MIVLQTMDMFWVDHLEMMDYLRSSVNLRAYGQRDPLVEYKKEGLHLFKEMEQSVKDEVAKLIPNIAIVSEDGGLPKAMQEVHEGTVEITRERMPIRNAHEEIGRNDECPCGSGKKWKKCGMLSTPEHQKNMAAKG
jgi:preprotein translocase subunit SecA